MSYIAVTFPYFLVYRINIYILYIIMHETVNNCCLVMKYAKDNIT